MEKNVYFKLLLRSYGEFFIIVIRVAISEYYKTRNDLWTLDVTMKQAKNKKIEKMCFSNSTFAHIVSRYGEFLYL